MVPTKPKLRSLKCTQCGGSIKLHGGHKVLSIVCQYCGTCMDTKKEFQALYQFANHKKPFSPLKIGQKATLKGIKFLVIGILQYEQREDGEVYRWLEYLLFSQTHGYVWLCLEDGHWCLIHEVKDIPDEQVSISMPRKSQFTVRGKKFKTFECASAQISYVAGELTWVAKQGERISYQDAICPPYLYSLEKRGRELEFFWGEYIPHTEIAKAFNVELYEPVGIYSCQPLSVNPIFDGFGKAAVVAMIMSIIAYLIIMSNGTLIFNKVLSSKVFGDGIISKSFKVDNTDTLFGMTLKAPRLSNSWAYYDIKVTNKKGTTTYFSMPVSLEYYYGGSGEDSWSEGSRNLTKYFKLPEIGEYVVSVAAEGGRGNSETSSSFYKPSTTLTIQRGARCGHYTLAWFFACLAVSTMYILYIASFEKRRWSDGDEEDDD